MVIPGRLPHFDTLANRMGKARRVSNRKSQDNNREPCNWKEHTIPRDAIHRKKKASDYESGSQITEPEEQRDRNQNTHNYGENVIEARKVELCCKIRERSVPML